MHSATSLSDIIGLTLKARGLEWVPDADGDLVGWAVAPHAVAEVRINSKRLERLQDESHKPAVIEMLFNAIKSAVRDLEAVP